MKPFFLCCLFLCASPLGGEPTEYRSSYACRQQIREAAHQLRTLVETRVREEIPGVFEKIQVLRKLYPIIDTLEWNALACCKAGQMPDRCVLPLVEQFNKWNSEGFIKYASNT